MIEFTKQDFRMERFDIEKREYPQRWVDYPTLDRVDEREIESTYLRKFIEKHGDKVTISASAAYKPKDPRLLRFEEKWQLIQLQEISTHLRCHPTRTFSHGMNWENPIFHLNYLMKSFFYCLNEAVHSIGSIVLYLLHMYELFSK